MHRPGPILRGRDGLLDEFTHCENVGLSMMCNTAGKE